MSHRGHGVFGARHLLVGLWLIALSAATVSRAQSDAPPDAKPIFLVTDVAVGEGVPVDKASARDVLATRFGRLKGKIEVRSMQEARATVDAAAMAMLTGGGSDEDLARIENYMNVDRLVLGRVASVGGVIDVQVKVFNVKEGVTEVGFARRLGKDADRAMVLALLDTLADSLLAWVIDHYTDGALSAEAAAMQNKKIAKARAEAPAPTASPWSGMGVVGGVLAGAGAGVLGAGVVYAVADADVSTVDIALLAGGGAALLLGGTAVALDLGDGAE